MSASDAVLLLVLVGCGFFLGFVTGIWFVLGGGLYVNEYGAVDIRWPPGPKKKTSVKAPEKLVSDPRRR